METAPLTGRSKHPRKPVGGEPARVRMDAPFCMTSPFHDDFEPDATMDPPFSRGRTLRSVGAGPSNP